MSAVCVCVRVRVRVCVRVCVCVSRIGNFNNTAVHYINRLLVNKTSWFHPNRKSLGRDCTYSVNVFRRQCELT